MSMNTELRKKNRPKGRTLQKKELRIRSEDRGGRVDRVVQGG